MYLLMSIMYTFLSHLDLWNQSIPLTTQPSNDDLSVTRDVMLIDLHPSKVSWGV